MPQAPGGWCCQLDTCPAALAACAAKQAVAAVARADAAADRRGGFSAEALEARYRCSLVIAKR
jgi:hypothetical protein